MLASLGFVSVISLVAGVGEGTRTPWEEYVQSPTAANAKLVEAIEYKTQDEGEFLQRAETDIDVLENQVLRSKSEAVSLGFRALAHADGHMGELLSQVLGRLIRVNATLFLKELRNHRSSVTRLDSLVGDLGSRFVDEDAAKRRELAARIAALKSVADPKLRAVRDECVAELAREP